MRRPLRWYWAGALAFAVFCTVSEIKELLIYDLTPQPLTPAGRVSCMLYWGLMDLAGYHVAFFTNRLLFDWIVPYGAGLAVFSLLRQRARRGRGLRCLECGCVLRGLAEARCPQCGEHL